MKNDEKITQFLKACNVDSIDKLTDEQIVYLYTDITPERGQFNAVDVYAERTDDDAHRFADDVRKCIKSEHIIVVNAVMNEGIDDDVSDQYKFTYSII